MIARKTPFTCLNCHEENPVIPANERNHCRKCLYSLHVDDKNPGDRLSNCKNFMEPVYVSIDGKKGYIITHRCMECGQIKRNKAAPDDNMNLIGDLSAVGAKIIEKKTRLNKKMMAKNSKKYYWLI